MTSSETFMSDPRRRNLAILAAATLVMVLLAIAALWQEAAETSTHFTPQTFFAGLAAKLNDAAHVHVESKKGAFDAVHTSKGWVVASRNNYPASLDVIRQTLVGMAALETLEPKTARADWLHYLDLDAPPKGDGVLIRVSDASGHELAAMIAGKSQDVGDQSGAVGLFVRKPDETQSWLALSPFEPKADASDWMDKAVLNVDRARIQEVGVTPASGPGFVVRREKPSDPDFVLSPIPKGREVANEAAPDGVAAAIVNFAFDDIQPAGNFDFSKPTRLVTRTFDGLTVTVNAVTKGSDVWATVGAEPAPGNADAAKEAIQINSRAAGWAYKVPAFKGQQITTTLDSLLKPLASPATTTP
jgi:hypothetical protein